MADQKISELTVANSAAGADLLHIVQGGSNKKLTFTNFLANINSPVVFNQSQGDTSDVRVAGDTDVYLLMADVSADKVGVGTQTPAEKLDVNGNLSISGGFLRLAQSPQSISGNGAVVANVTAAISTLTTNATANAVVSLADGVSGQIKTFVMITDGGYDAVLSPSNRIGFTSITFNDVGDTATLMFINSKWVIISYYGVTIA
jgi:hypothetical protein